MSTPEVKRLFWLAVLALIFTAAIAALAIWCASRPVVSFPLAPKSSASPKSSAVSRSSLPLSTPCARQPETHNLRDALLAAPSLPAPRFVPGVAYLPADTTPAFVTNPSGGAMAPAVFSARMPLVMPAVILRRKVVSGDLPPEGVIFDITHTSMAAAWLSDFRSARMAVSLASREGAHV